MGTDPYASARELGLMIGTPPPPGARVTRGNWFYAPHNRWAFSNMTQIAPTAEVSRGSGPVRALPERLADPAVVEALPVVDHEGVTRTVGEVMRRTWGDAMVVLKKGELVYERYDNDLQPDQLHLLASVTKSFTGLLALIAIEEGLLDPDRPAVDYVPELAAGVFADTTVQQVLDMVVAAQWDELDWLAHEAGPEQEDSLFLRFLRRSGTWVDSQHETDEGLLDFAATVYNGGRGPLVAEGFRKGSKKVMRAYQFFYRGDRQVGSARVGTMKYDKRPSHRHWHFEDFAVYDLVKSRTKKRALRTSGKEAFCLAPTDSIDLLVPNAPADPGNGDLATACGDLSSIWVREVLANGWGDTYTQYRAGQSIDITGLRNGTYWIRVRANPGHRLYEARTTNNTSFRRVILGGTPGARTVRVPKYGRIDSERGLDVGGGED